MKRPLKRGLLLAILAIAVFIPLSRGAWDYANDKSDWFEIGVDADYLNPGYINSTNGTTVTTNPTKPNNTNTTPNTTTPNTTTPNTTTPNTTQPNTTTPNTTTPNTTQPNTTTPNTTTPNTTTPNTTTPNTTTPNTTTSTPSNFLTSSGWNYTKDKSDWFEMGSDADYLTPGSINGTTGGTTTPNTTTPNTTTPNTTQPNTTTPNTTTPNTTQPNTTQPNTTQPNNTGGNNNTWYWNYSTDTSDWFDLGNDSNSNIQGNVNQTAQNSGGGTTTPNTTTPNTTKPNNTNTTPNTTQPNNTGGTGGNNNTWYWNYSTDTSDWFDLGNDTYSNIIGNVNETAKTTGPTSNQLNQSTNTSSGGTTNTSSGGTTNTSSGGTTTQNTTKNPNNNSTYWNWATDTSQRFDLGSDSDALGVTGAASTTSPNYGADQFDLSDATDLNDGVDLTDPAGLGTGFQVSGPNNTLPIGNSGRTLGAGAIVLLFSVAVNALLA